MQKTTETSLCIYTMSSIHFGQSAANSGKPAGTADCQRSFAAQYFAAQRFTQAGTTSVTRANQKKMAHAQDGNVFYW